MTNHPQRGYRVAARLALAMTVLSLASCGGGGGGGTTRYSIGGTVSGLAGTLVLQNNGADNLTLTRDARFSFPTLVPQGSTYSVTVLSAPAGQLCTVANAAGTARANVSNVAVTCTTRLAYTLGGTITGLGASGLTIASGSGNVVAPVSGATTFTLPAGVPGDSVYDVGITSQPTGQTCVILNAYGAVNSTDVTEIDVRCLGNVTSPLRGTYNTMVPGPTTANYSLTFFDDGVYMFGSVMNDAACGVSLGNGVEYGVYRYNAGTGVFEIRSAVIDTNGSCGLWNGSSQVDGTLSVAGSGSNTLLTLTTGSSVFQYLAADSTPGLLIGSWADPYQRGYTAFADAGGTSVYTLSVWTQRSPVGHDNGYRAGIETSCGTATTFAGGDLLMDSASVLCTTPVPGIPPPVDTNGEAGLSSYGTEPIPFAVDVDLLTLFGTTYPRLTPP